VIAPAEVERVKNGTDLVTLIQSRGIDLKKKGRSWQGRCPFHADGKTPSLSVLPERALWKCFGCGKGGDAIRFVELHDKLGFREAVIKLGGSATVAAHRTSKQAAKEKMTVRSAPKPAMPPPGQVKLLARVVDFYRRAFDEDPRGAEYLRGRGIKDRSTYEAFRVGLASGKLRETLPRDGEIIEGLRSLGVLTASGTELLLGCVVVPLLDDQGAPVGLYGRKIVDGEPRHLYLPGPRRGLVVPQAARTMKELIVTEGILDAMALWDAGYTNLLPAWGVTGWTDAHRELIEREQVRELYICFDGDEAGREGAARLADELRTKGLRSVVVPLPEGQDVNDVVRTGGAGAVESLLRAADAGVGERASFPFHRSRHGYEKTPTGFKVTLAGRCYEMKGIVRSPTRLRCAVRAQHGARFHLDTLDLYAARARAVWVRACAALFAVDAAVIEQDLRRLIEYAEADTGEAVPDETAAGLVATPDEEAAAIAFLQKPDLLDQVVADLTAVGYAGEDTNKLLGYLACTSRKLDDPLSVLIQSRSAAGKSFLADVLCELVPPEDLRRYTRVTGQALYYLEEDGLAHKILSIEEAAGAEDAAYSIRALQSAKSLSVAVTTKDPQSGRMRTDEYHVKGPATFLLTTTTSDVDPETLSRFLVLTVDETEQMTARIHALQRHGRTVEGLRGRRHADAVVRRHHVAQRLLRPMPVVIPYAPLLRFPSKPLRTRRDHRKYLGLIEAVAFLHQHQRPVKELATEDGEVVSYIEATLADLAAANRLARAVLERTLDELSAPARTLLGEIKRLCEAQAQGEVKPEYSFGRRELREQSGWSMWQLRTHLAELEQNECIESLAGSQGKQYVYRLNVDEEGKPLNLDLSEPAEVAKAAKAAGIEVSR
jgi:DNA primase catalytic core